MKLAVYIAITFAISAISMIAGYQLGIRDSPAIAVVIHDLKHAQHENDKTNRTLTLHSGNSMHIGLIEGTGVASTVVYYQRLTAAVEALGGSLDLTIDHANVQDLIRTNPADDRITRKDAT